jgi:hypothetical protein
MHMNSSFLQVFSHRVNKFRIAETKDPIVEIIDDAMEYIPAPIHSNIPGSGLLSPCGCSALVVCFVC